MGEFRIVTTSALFAIMVLEYAIFTYVTGQTTQMTRDSKTFPVCSSHLCAPSSCENPSGNPPPCRCDYACVVFGDCCVDYADANMTMPCRSKDEVRFREIAKRVDRSQLTCLTLPQGTESYLVVSGCPVDWDDDNVRSKCEDASPSPLIDINTIPVSHNGSLSYKNVFCAQCHGHLDVDILVWRIEFRCPPTLTREVIDGTRSIATLLNNEKCEYSLDPPLPSSVSALRTCSNTSDVITSCPADSNKDIHDLCSSYHGIVSEGQSLYGNPYCQLCNTGHNVTGNHLDNAVEDICQHLETSTKRPPDQIQPTNRPTKRPPIRPLPSDDTNTTASTDRLDGRLQPLSVIMDFSRDKSVIRYESESNTIEVTDVCQKGEVFDPFTEQCLKLYCAEGYELRDSSCYRLVPPLNLTCGADNANLIITLSVSILQKTTEMHACIPEEGIKNITSFIEQTLNLTESSLQDPNIPSPFRNSSCDMFINGSLNLEFISDARLISYSELEEHADRALLLYDLPFVHPELALHGLSITQKCMSIMGLDRCKDNLKTLQNAQVTSLNGTTYVQDKQTNDLYHSYETVFQAEYQAIGEDRTRNSYTKSLRFQICPQTQLQSCTLITKNASLFEPVGGDIGLLNNTITGEVLGPDEYFLTSTGSIRYCAPDDYTQNGTLNETIRIFSYDEGQVFLSFIGISISLLALLITFTTYCIFSNLRRCVSNKLITALCFVLFLAQLLQMLSGFGASIPELCLALSALSHFVWTAVFALTTCLAFELDRTLGSRDSFSLPTNNPRAVLSYLMFTFTISSVLVGTCLAIHFTVGEQLNFSYGSPNECWIVDQTANLVAFGCPQGVFIIANILLFAHTVTGIRQTTKVRKSMIMEAQSMKETMTELRVYLRISTLLGFTWLFGYVAGFAGVKALWYVFIVLNSLQGLYIFLAFMANRRVLGMWMALLCCDGKATRFSRISRGSSSLPLSVRVTRLTSVSSLPRGVEQSARGERRNTNDKTGGRVRYSGVSQKVAGERRTSGPDQSRKSDDREMLGSGDRKSSAASDRPSPANDRRYSNGEKKAGGDRKYVTASERRYSNGNKNTNHK